MVRIRSSCWMAPQLLPREAGASYSRGALWFCALRNALFSQCRRHPGNVVQKPPFLAIPILSTARSDAAMGLASKQQGTAMSTGLNFSGPERDYVSIRVSAEKSKTVSDLDRKSDT